MWAAENAGRNTNRLIASGVPQGIVGREISNASLPDDFAGFPGHIGKVL